MLNVGFDSQIFRLQKRGGISKYFTNLINEFTLNPDLGVAPKLLFAKSNNKHLEELQVNLKNNSVCEEASNSNRKFNPRLNSLDLVHHTYYLPGTWFWNWDGVHISTIHDMIPEKTDESFGLINPHFMKKYYVKKSNGNIAVSDCTKIEALNFYGESANKIERIHHGVDHVFFRDEAKKNFKGDSSSFFMFVGKRSGYKNFSLALKAMSLLPKSFKLVAVGGGELTKSEIKLISKLNLDGQISQCAASEVELAQLYSQAIALIVPSKFEGFGMSSLEAMASGCPVLTSTAEALVEIGGNAALTFDPENYEHLSHLMTEVFTNQEIRQTLKYLGMRRASKFSWFECAKNTATFYASFLS
jgi:glycosyltransferase involved in cell wall biosynthesis